MNTRLHKFARLPRTEQWLVCQAAVRLAAATIAVRICAAPRLVSGMSARPASGRKRKAISAERIAWSVEACARLLPFATCLPRSLALCSLLHAYGYPAQIRIGVRSSDGVLKAHAWVECGGTPLSGDNSEFQPLPVFPA